MDKSRKIYIVTFEIHHNCQIVDFVYYCYATNAKEACNICKYNWRGDGHQFHVHAVKSNVQDVELLKINNWKSKYICGKDLIGKYWNIGFKTWRYKTKTGYEYPLMKQ